MFVRVQGPIPILPTRRAIRWTTRFTVMVAIVVLLAALLTLAGCQSTPARRAYITVEGATDAVNGVSDAFQANLLTKAQLTAIAPYADAVKKAQDSLDNAMLKGDSVGIATYSAALSDAVTELLNQEAAAKRVKVSATKP